MDDAEIYELMAWLFGETAATAQRGASERLLSWAKAMEGWLEERRRLSASTHKQARLTWKRLLTERGKMPWELDRGDFEAHMEWMRAQGYAASTRANAMGICSHFYRWCGRQGVEAGGGGDFDPAGEARRPKVRRYGGQALLSMEEVEALMRTLRKDATPVGLRDTAFLLGRLRLGVPLRSLQRLQWGMIEADETGAWVRWREGGERGRLPGEVWEAIEGYLAGSGRLGGMRAEKFIFSPLKYPGVPEMSRQAEGWREGAWVSTSSLLASLKLYGKAAGIAEGKLTLQGLRRTAMRLRLDAGGSLEEMRSFLDSQEEAKFTKHRLGFLPELPESGEAGRVEADPPGREARPFREGEGVKHGFYARRQPAEGVREVMAEGKSGLGDELEGLRELARGLVEREMKAPSRQEATVLMEAYSKAAARIGELSAALKAEQESEEEQKESWAEQLLQALQEVSDELDLGMDQQAVREEALGGEGRLDEEIATLRYLLRRARQQAQEAQEGREFARLVEIYGMGCIRLARLLRREGDQRQRLERFMRKMTDQAIREVGEELGLK